MEWNYGYTSAWTPYAEQVHTTRRGRTSRIRVTANPHGDDVLFQITASVTDADGNKTELVPSVPYRIFAELRGRALAAIKIKPERGKAEG